jgi:predicted dehydrogenase
MKIGIIGCGFIGHKRAKHIGECQLVACADKNLESAQKLADNYQCCEVFADWKDMLSDANIDIIIIATPHNMLAEMTLAAVTAKKHVLVEKPAAIHSSELPRIIELADTNNVLVRVGFNHRYHRALCKAREIIKAGQLGNLMFLRARYGHGGRTGYDKEWRADPKLSGGGELIDQGVHIIDLARHFLGEFTDITGYAHTYYWDMPVDDNAFLLLKTKDKQVAFLHASCTEWKNLFSLEIYGHNGKLAIDGLGGSYGTETLTFYKMLPEMGPPETTRWEYPMADNSWEVEFSEFIEDIQLKRQPAASLTDAKAALNIVEEIYRESNL